MNIAVAGKGGVGKTSFSALIIKSLLEEGKGPVLAVDADPNSNLHTALGMEFDQTIADLREEALKGKVPEGMAKADFVNLKVEETIVEGNGVDLLIMGHPEGKGCYCAVNNLLRGNMSSLCAGYEYVVIDNEAGMEHLSRRTTDDIDILFLISDPTLVGIRSAKRAFETAQNINLRIKKFSFIINRLNGKLSEGLKQEIAKLELPFSGVVHNDAVLARRSEAGESLLSMDGDSGAAGEVGEIVNNNFSEVICRK